MNVVMLGPFGLHPKGTMRARALPAARALAARGHRVTLVMPPWHTPDEAGRKWTDRAREPGAGLEYVSLAGIRLPLVGHAIVARRMAARALALEPDVVHAFKPKAYSGLAAGLLRARQRLGAAFALVMDTDDWEGPGGWNDLEPYGPLQRWVFARQERWGLTHADAVTVASRALEALVWSLGVSPARVTYLPNAIGGEVLDGASATARGDASTGVPAAPAPPPDPGPRPQPDSPGRDAGRPPTLLLYTRFFEYDLERPIEVLARVRRESPTARLVVVGKGLFGEEATFLEHARRAGLADAVDYRGWEEADRLPGVLAEADVALYPFDDTLVNRAKSSVKLLELLAAGVPVVAEAVGQNREVIEDGASGLLVPPGDASAFARAVIALLGDADRRREIASAARERVRRRFSWGRQVEALEGVYDRARARRSGTDRYGPADRRDDRHPA
jgi:glycosyltransferase involved in cell wall biosynthesis